MDSIINTIKNLKTPTTIIYLEDENIDFFENIVSVLTNIPIFSYQRKSIDKAFKSDSYILLANNYINQSRIPDWAIQEKYTIILNNEITSFYLSDVEKKEDLSYERPRYGTKDIIAQYVEQKPYVNYDILFEPEQLLNNLGIVSF